MDESHRSRGTTIIGRLTFSAGMNCAMDLEKNTEAIFVGEPTESSPNQYGDPTRIVLPQSGIGVSVSTRYWEDGGPSDHRPWLAPRVPAVLTSKDYREYLWHGQLLQQAGQPEKATAA